MRRLLILGLCLSVVALASTSANAGALSLLFPDSSTVNLLEDQDWEYLVDSDEDGLVSEGDYLVGMIYIQDVFDAEDLSKNNTATDSTFSAVFVLEVTDVSDASGLKAFTFGAAGKDVWDTLEDADGNNLGLSDPVDDETVGVVYDDSSDPFQDPGAGTILADALDTATDGTLLWEWGFREGDATEFWNAIANTDDINSLFILQVYASLNQTHSYAAGDSIDFLKHNFQWDGVADSTNPLGLNVYSEIQGYGGLPSVDEGHFDIATDTDFYIVPTPEPGSLALLGLGLLAGGIVIRRRRS